MLQGPQPHVWASWAAITNGHKAMGLKQQKRISQSGGQKSEIKVCGSHAPSDGSGDTSCLLQTPGELPAPLAVVTSPHFCLRLQTFLLWLSVSEGTSTKTLFLKRSHSDVPGGHAFWQVTVQPSPDQMWPCTAQCLPCCPSDPLPSFPPFVSSRGPGPGSRGGHCVPMPRPGPGLFKSL